MRANIHLGRRQRGPDSPAIEALYAALLLARQRAGGRFTLLEPKAAWTGNSSFESFIGLSWRGEEPWLLAVVNYSDHQSQCYLPLPFEALRGRTLSLEDRLSQIVYKREGARLLAEGLYLDMPAWGCHVFEVWSSLTTP